MEGKGGDDRNCDGRLHLKTPRKSARITEKKCKREKELETTDRESSERKVRGNKNHGQLTPDDRDAKKRTKKSKLTLVGQLLFWILISHHAY